MFAKSQQAMVSVMLNPGLVAKTGLIQHLIQTAMFAIARLPYRFAKPAFISVTFLINTRKLSKFYLTRIKFNTLSILQICNTFFELIFSLIN